MNDTFRPIVEFAGDDEVKYYVACTREDYPRATPVGAARLDDGGIVVVLAGDDMIVHIVRIDPNVMLPDGRVSTRHYHAASGSLHVLVAAPLLAGMPVSFRALNEQLDAKGMM